MPRFKITEIDPTTGHVMTRWSNHSGGSGHGEKAALDRLRGNRKPKPPPDAGQGGAKNWLRDPYPWE